MPAKPVLVTTERVAGADTVLEFRVGAVRQEVRVPTATLKAAPGLREYWAGHARIYLGAAP